MDKTTSLQYMTPLVIGGAGFGYQLNSDPEAIPISKILRNAFDSGVRTLDTSPYYEPSEQLLGAALKDPAVAEKYSRDQYIIMTKVGRVTEKHLNYSPPWLRESVARSLQRFDTEYLDVVFVHDVELVTFEEATIAVGVLFEIADSGRVRNVGISGYDIDVLADIAELCPKLYGRSIDVVQTWAQLTLQNTQVEKHGFPRFRAAGVKMVFCSSPLAIGLLRSESVPKGRLGEWHPAPEGLRIQAQKAAAYVAQEGHDLASLALRYSIRKAQRNSSPEMLVSTICGVSSEQQLQQNVQTIRHALGGLHLDEYRRMCSLKDLHGQNQTLFDAEVERTDASLCSKVRDILKPWLDYDFSKKRIAYYAGSAGIAQMPTCGDAEKLVQIHTEEIFSVNNARL